MAGTIADGEGYFQNKIDSMLITTSWVDQARHLMGVEAASQVWGDTPGWYIWLSNAQGTYHVELLDIVMADAPEFGQNGLFSIKCYPHADAVVFDTFSFEEKRLLKSPFFDETQTPRFEAREKIPPSFFNVAALEFQLSEDETMACFTLESLDVMRSVYPAGPRLYASPITESRHLRSGDTIRSVPGWELGYPLFDRLLSMYAFYGSSGPVRLRVTRSQGFEYVCTGENTFDCASAPEVRQLAMSVFFGTGCRKGPCPSDVAKDRRDGHTDEVLLDIDIECGHFHGSDQVRQTLLKENIHINTLWWSIATLDHRSQLASSCVCH